LLGNLARMQIDGTTATGFEPVRDAFAENFASRGEIVGALCVTVGGRVVADLRGGSAAGSGPSWRPDTLVNLVGAGHGAWVPRQHVHGEMGPRWQNPRNRALIEGLYSCV
jgi:hypothetical protein